MAETSSFVPNLEEIMKEYVPPEEETRQEEPMEKIPTEAPEAPAVSKEGTREREGQEKKISTSLCQRKLTPTGRSTMPTKDS